MTFPSAILRRLFRLQRWCHGRPWLVFGLTLAILALLLSAAGRIQTSNDPMLLFGEHNPQKQKLYRQQAQFGEANDTLIVIAGPQGGPLAPLLVAERALSALLSDPGNPLRPDGVVALSSLSSLLPDLGYMLDYTPIEDVAIIIDEKPLLRDAFFNNDLSALLLSLRQDLPDQSDAALARAYAQEQTLLAHLRAANPGLDFAIVGNVAMAEALRSSIEFDRLYLLPLVLLLNLVVLLVAFGNLRVALVTLALAMSAVFATLGLAGWSGLVFGAGAVSSFSIVMTLTVASLIHVIHSLGQRQRALPFQRASVAIPATFRRLAVPVTLAHVTTAIGFLSLNWADAPAFQAMGNLVAVGLIASLLLVVLVAPAAYTSACGPCTLRDGLPRAITRALTGAWSRAPRRWAIAIGLVCAVSVGGLVQTRFDDQFISLFPPDHPLRTNIDLISERMGWSQNVDLVLRYPPEALITPEAFQTLDELVLRLRGLDGVVGISGPLDILRACLAERDPPQTGPFSEVPQRVLNFCVRSTYLVTPEEGNPTFAADFRAVRISLLVPRLSSANVRALAVAVESEAQAAGFAPGDAEASGMNVMSAYLAQVNTLSMLTGTAMAMAVVSLLIGLFLRSARLALLSVLPNFLPAMAALGLWVWLQTEVGMAASIIAALTFGIVVDDTIHILYALSRRRRRQTSAGAARALQKVMPGVLTTTVTLSLGFAMLAFSDFEVNRQLGILTAGTILFAFVFDLFVLPTLYIRLMNRKPPRDA